MTAGEMMLFVGLVLNAAAMVVAFYRISLKIEIIHRATNSMKDELVNSVRDAAMEAGIKEGRSQGRAITEDAV